MANLASFRRSALALALTAGAGAAWADDELAIQAYDEDGALAGVEAILNGTPVGVTGADGSLLLDLSAGGQVLILKVDGQEKVLRFTTGDGQLADVVLNVSEQQIDHFLDVFSAVESAAEKRDVAKGTLVVNVRKGSKPASNQLVLVSGSGAVSTNAQGRAQIDVPRGLVTVRLGDDSKQVRVLGGVTRGVRFDLPGDEGGIEIAMPSIEEVVVLGTFNPAGMEVSERDTSSIVDTMDNELLVRFSDADVAAAVVRVPGISVQDDKYVFIRGLGGRYITTTLNGSTMPSTNPSKRTVPLDLFPSNFVNQLDIKKTFLSTMPGESTGGNLVINTKAFPDEPGGSISVSLGYGSEITGNTVAVDPAGGDFDWLGWDDGTREEDIAVATIADMLSQGTFVANDGASYTLTPNVTGELLRLGGILIADDWDVDFKTATPDLGLGLDYGNIFYLGDAEIGFYAAGNYSNSWSSRVNGIRRSYSGSGLVGDDLSYSSTTNEIEASGLLSVGVNIGESSYEWNSLISRSTESFVERSVGREGDEFRSIYGHTIQWEERQYISTQILGSHTLNESGSFFVDWQFTASQARRYVPQRTDVRFRAFQNQTDAETLRQTYDFSASNASQTDLLKGFVFEDGNSSKRWDDLTDANFDASADFSLDLIDDGASFSSVFFGLSSIYRERDTESSTFGYFNDGRDSALEVAPNVEVSDVIYLCGVGDGTQACADNTVGGIQDNPRDGYIFRVRTAVSDVYEAELDYNSAYVSYDHTFDSTWQVVLGARYESYQQTTDTFDLTTGAPVQGIVDDKQVLPSLGVNWFYSEDQQLRLAFSKTVARPDFKEASNAVFYDTEFNFRVRGNPFLDVATIVNADLRWEWYFEEGDSVSIAVFYKDFDKPIERVVLPASGTAGNSRTFANSDTGELKGFEIEGRKEFFIGDDYDDSIFITFNAAYIESEVIGAGVGQDTRALQGQPEYTANLVLGYDDFASGQQLTLLLNQNGESIADVGVSGAPDVIFEPRLDVNLVYRWDFSESGTLKFKANNLTDSEYEYTQGGQIFQQYSKGRSVSIGFDWKF